MTQLLEYVVIFIAGPYCSREGEGMGIFLFGQQFERRGGGLVDGRRPSDSHAAVGGAGSWVVTTVM